MFCVTEKHAATTDEVEEHPIVEYVHVQCQSCGRRVPDAFPAEEVCSWCVFLGWKCGRVVWVSDIQFGNIHIPKTCFLYIPF